MSTKLTLLLLAPAPLLTVRRPSATVTTAVPSTQRAAEVGVPLTTGTPTG